MFKNIISRFSLFFSILLMLLATASGSAWAQNVVEAWDPQGYGFYLKKVVSDTAICSGQTFSYTIYFSFPAGTQSATILDNVPSPLVVDSVSVLGCGTPTITAPPPGTGGQVSLVYSSGSIPSGGCSGSMTIVVSFPNGVTCNGTSVRNRVCMTATIQTPSDTGMVTGMVKFCTEFVTTTAKASNPWQIEKKVLNGTWGGGNCPWKVFGDTVTYKICVYKNNPAPCGGNGQLNLVNGVVTDVLPTGAFVIQPLPAGVTYNNNTNTITWNVGNLSATQPFNIVCVTLTVYYPPAQFPTNSQITNTATLTGQLGSPQQPCGQFQLSSTVCWQKILPPPDTTQASLYKWGSTNGQPGCAGTYWIRFCNTGNTMLPANSVVIRDTLPATLTLISASGSSNLTVTTSGNNIVTATLNAQLQPKACTYVTVNFTISQSATPNSTITNCAYATVQGLTQPLSSCWSFVVNAPAPKPCVWKGICSPQNSYSLGQVIRMRLRVQNIGGLPINGATITDNLNPNFEYVGNPNFYKSNTWNTPCNPTTGVTAWTPAPNISVSGQTVTISNVNIPASCQSVFWNGCGMYGNNTVPYYWIEFDVKIRDTAALGNIPNSFTLSGGGVSTPVTSNTVLVLTTGQVGFTLTKGVAPDTSSWASSLNVSPGGTLYYRLRMPLAAGSVPLRHATFVDLLPRDSGTSDNRILPISCPSRGSQFDVTYQAGVLTSHPVNWYTNTNTTTQASATAISAVTGAPPQLFPTSCGNGTPWTAGVSPGDKNLGIYFTTAVGASLVPTVIFQAKAAQGATPGQIACNSFAAGGAVRHYLNSSTAQDVPVAPLESGNVCITIDSTSGCDTIGEVHLDSACCQFTIPIFLAQGPAIGGVTSIQWSLSGGTMESISPFMGCPFTLTPPNPYGTTSGTITFTPPCTVSPLNLGMEANPTTATGEVTLYLIINHKGQVCYDTVKLRCSRAPITKCDSLAVAPFSYGNLQLSGRTFTIFNQKQPASPIKRVEISFNPPPCVSSSAPQGDWNGGGLVVDGGTRSWGVASSGTPKYSLIAMTCVPDTSAPQGNAANNTVKFNLGVDITCGWTGNVILTVIHCDGDTCVLTYNNWCAKPPKQCLTIDVGSGFNPIPVTLRQIRAIEVAIDTNLVPGTQNLHACTASIVPTTKGWEVLGVSIEDELTKEERESGKYLPWEGEVKLTKADAARTGLIELQACGRPTKPIKGPWLIRAFLGSREPMSDTPTVNITFYDANANPIALGEAKASILVSSVPVDIISPNNNGDGIIGIVPNPATDNVRIDYILTNGGDVVLEIWDNLGQLLFATNKTHAERGFQSALISTSELPAGSYFVRLRTAKGISVAPLRIIR